MRSAQSRMGIISSLASARKDVGRCVDAMPLSVRSLKVGGAAFAGLAGVALLRSLFGGRKRGGASAPAPPQRSLGRYLLTESVVMLLLPLCRRFLLGDGSVTSARLGGLLDNLMKKGR